MVERTWSVVAADVAVNRLPPAGMATLRLRGFDTSTLDAVSGALGVALPTHPSTSTGNSSRALCLAPGEWMIVGHTGAPGAVLAAAAGAKVAHLADVGAGVVTYAVSGTAARDLLAKGCTLDLHARAFLPDQCAQTLLAQVGVVVDRRPDGDDLVVHASASYAHHLEAWFADAAIEFHAEVTA